MLQSIQAQRPIIAKFDRNITALSELCSAADADNLREINEQVTERFTELANAFKERGDALNSTIEQSSQFSDRLNVFLANLDGAAAQLRQAEPPSARPPVLNRQLVDNAQVMELLKQKEAAFRAMKESAQEVLMQSRATEPAVKGKVLYLLSL